MQVRLGELLAECPYCGSKDFQPADADSEETIELACAHCDGHASRVLILERLAERAGELGALTLARLKAERRAKRKRP